MSKATQIEWLDKAQARQAIENNALSPDEIAMFEMFEREGWDHERRRKYILSMLPSDEIPLAAE